MPLALTAADAPQPISVAIFDFSTPYKARLKNDVGVISSLLTANLSSSTLFSVVDRAELRKIQKEQALGLSGDISPETAAKIGKLVGAKVLVTGQIFSMNDDVTPYDQPNGQGKVLIVANVIGTETGRVFAEREQGARENLVKLADELSGKISGVITNDYTNLVAGASATPAKTLADVINALPRKPRPVVSVQITEQLLRAARPGQTAQTELETVFKEAGFEVVDEKSDKQPDIVISGTATTAVNGSDSGLISASAMLNLKAQERLTGKILAVDRQDSTGVDLNRQTAAKKALADAADNLAERLLPALVQ